MTHKNNVRIFAVFYIFYIFCPLLAEQKQEFNLAKTINYLNFGFDLGSKPFLWPLIPSATQGEFLKLVPNEDRRQAYILGAIGTTTGLALWMFATYGAYKFFTNNETQK